MRHEKRRIHPAKPSGTKLPLQRTTPLTDPSEAARPQPPEIVLPQRRTPNENHLTVAFANSATSSSASSVPASKRVSVASSVSSGSGGTIISSVAVS